MRDINVIGTLTLPGEDRSVRAVRAFVRDMLPERHPAADDLQLCGVELFTNAIRHTRSGRGGRVTLTLGTTADVLVLQVIDDGAHGHRPALRAPEPPADDESESGRGLRIVDALSLDWGYHPEGDRTTVWAHFKPART